MPKNTGTANVFARITKVDEAKRTVIGRAVEEVVDKSGEIFDYKSSKPHFSKWSNEISADTEGKSLGNVRAMHGKVAAGKVIQIDFNDNDKAIDIAAKVVDDAEWQKVLEGVYTGFSIGGSYVGDKTTEKIDGVDIKRYTASPSEISLVDRPCIPTCKFFEVQRADGSLFKVDFKEPESTDEEKAAATDAKAKADAELVEMGKYLVENGVNRDDLKKLDAAGLRKAYELAKAPKVEKVDDGVRDIEATPAEVDQFTALLVEKRLTLADVVTLVKNASPVAGANVIKVEEPVLTEDPKVEELARNICKACGEDPDGKHKVQDGNEVPLWTLHKDSAVAMMEKVAARKDVSPKEGEDKYGDVSFADEKNKKYPIDTPSHIRAAWNYINKEKNAAKYDASDVKVIKGKIVSAWKEKIDKEGPPSADEKNTKTAQATLRKSLYNVSDVVSALTTLYYCCSSLQYEADYEGDGSPVPLMIANVLDDLGDVLKALVGEETDELLAAVSLLVGNGVAQPDTMKMVADARKVIAKLVEPATLEKMQGDLQKIGARNSAADQSSIQEIHDAAVKLGCDCDADNVDEDDLKQGDNEKLLKQGKGGDLSKAVTAATEPLTKALDDLKKSLEASQAETVEVKKRLAIVEATPAAAKGSLRAVSKGTEVVDNTAGTQEPKPIQTPDGEVHKAAGLIRELHKSGGGPLLTSNR